MFSKKRLIVVVVSLTVGIILAVTCYYNAVETKPFHGSKHPPKSTRLSQSDLADKILDLESKVDELESKIDDMESDNSILRDRIGDAEQANGISRSRIDDLETQISRLKVSLSYR